eukprot:gene34052-41217_t
MDGGAYVDFPCEIRGNAIGPVLVFLAGFPDNPWSAWHPKIIEDLGITYKIILLSIPNNIDPKKLSSEDEEDFFPFLVDSLHHQLEKLGVVTHVSRDAPGDSRDPNTCENQQFVLMAHGMGCYLALLYENYLHESYPVSPMFKLILLDNGIKKTYMLSELLYIMVYELFYASIYLCRLYVSSLLATLYLKAVLIVMESFRWICRGESSVAVLKHILFHVHSSACYAYYHIAWARMYGKYQQTVFPHIPLLFMWGDRKQFLLHDDEFIWNIEAFNKSMPADTPHLHGRTYSFDPAHNTVITMDAQTSPLLGSEASDGEAKEASPMAAEQRNGETTERSKFKPMKDTNHYFTRKEPSKIIREVRSFLSDFVLAK